MKTSEQIHNEDGYVIFSSYEKYSVGDIVPTLIQMDNGDRDLLHPFRVTRIATRVEYIDQLLRHGADARRIMCRDYFYEARTD